MTDERDATPPGPGGDLEPTRTNIRAAARLSPGDGVGDRYTIVGRLGLGGMGEVYRARDEELGVEVALKVLRPEYAGDRTLLERFRREILLARQVTHGNVVRIHDLGKEGELVFLTMDLVEGRSLRQLLEEKGRFSADETAEIGRQLAEALAAAHAKGVVHRDLKPSNVMIDADGNAYVTDFGVARSITAPDLTRTGLVVGTPEYLSPEQVRGEDLDGRSDLYALGVLLFELLAGKPPTQGQTADEVVAQHLQGVPRRLAGLPEETPANLKAILRRCLEPDRRRRYADGAELARDLADLSRPRPRWPGWSGRGRLALWAGVGLALVAAALLLRPDRDAGAPGDRPAAALVVLPFADETGRPELAWLGPGVPELLFEALVGEPELRVVSPQRSLQAASDLKLAPGSLSESAVALAAEIFDSSRLLTGSVRSRADGGLRIDARLVDPAVGLDGAAFLHAEAPAGPDSARQVIADLQGELAASLRLGRRAREEAPLSSPALPQYSEAVRKLWEGDALGARDQLQEAVQADPGFGAAWLRLGQAYEANGQYDQALDATDRAVETLPQGPAGGGRLRLLARAQQARLAGEPERAQEILAQLVADYPGDVESGIALADAYGIEGRFGDALDLLAQVVERAPANPQAWYLRAKYSILSGQSRVAVDEYLVRAMVLQNKLGNRQGQADVLNAFGVAYRELGEMERAEESYERAADLRREVGDLRGYATTLRNLSQIAIFRGNLDDAETRLVAAKEIFEELGDDAGIAGIYNELGVVEETRSAYEASLERFRQALQIRRRLGDQRAIAESLNNIGFAHHQLGRYDDASVYWQQALDVYTETANVEGQVAVRQSLGQLAITRGEWGEAQRLFLEALEGARSLDWQAAIAASLGYLGRTAQAQGRYAAALESYGEALERFAELGDLRGQVDFSLALATARLELGDHDGALTLLDALDERLTAVASSDYRAEWALLRSVALRRRGETRRADDALATATTAAEASGSRVLGLRVRLERARAASSPPRLEEIWREARQVGDARLTLEAGARLAAARVASGSLAEAEPVLADLERTLRRMGDSAVTHRLQALRIEIAERQGADATAIRAARAAEIERLSNGLEKGLAETFHRFVGSRTEAADAA